MAYSNTFNDWLAQHPELNGQSRVNLLNYGTFRATGNEGEYEWDGPELPSDSFGGAANATEGFTGIRNNSFYRNGQNLFGMLEGWNGDPNSTSYIDARKRMENNGFLVNLPGQGGGQNLWNLNAPPGFNPNTPSTVGPVGVVNNNNTNTNTGVSNPFNPNFRGPATGTTSTGYRGPPTGTNYNTPPPGSTSTHNNMPVGGSPIQFNNGVAKPGLANYQPKDVAGQPVGNGTNSPPVTRNWAAEIANGGNLYGRTGFSLGQYLAGTPTQDRMGNPLDSPESQAQRLYNAGFFRQTNPGDESGSSRWATGRQDVDAQGYIIRNGVPYVQVGANQNRVRDPNAVTFDDEFGWITPAQNYNNQDSWVDRAAMPLFAAGLFPFLAQGGVFGAGLQETFGGTGTATGTSGAGTTATGPVGTGTNLENIGGSIVGGTADLGTTAAGGAGGFPFSASNILRGAGVVNALANGGSGGPVGTRTSQQGDGSFDLGNLLRNGLNVNQGNREFSQIRSWMDNYYDRGNFMSDPDLQYYLQRYRSSFENPDEFLNSQGYQDMRNRRLGDLSRSLNARGYNLSGNEMGELAKYGQELDFNQLNSERSGILNAARLGGQARTDMARAGISSLPFMAQQLRQRNQERGNAVNDVLGSILNSNNPIGQAIRAAGNTGMQWLNRIINGDQDAWKEIPEEIRRQLPDVTDEQINSWIRDAAPDIDNIPIESNPYDDIDSEFWDYIFRGL